MIIHMARVIRLKEQQHNRNRPARPTEQALKRSDGSIADLEYPMDTDENGFILTGANILENRKTSSAAEVRSSNHRLHNRTRDSLQELRPPWMRMSSMQDTQEPLSYKHA